MSQLKSTIYYTISEKNQAIKKGGINFTSYVFVENTGYTENDYLSATPEVNIDIIISLVLCIRSKRTV